MKYVLTGGPNCGKTTMLNLLASQGYYTIGESAQWVIERELKKQSDILPWKDLPAFQLAVLENQRLWEKDIPKAAFLDRSIIDGVGYCTEADIEIPEPLDTAAREATYQQVFILDPIPAFEKTAIRRDEHKREALQQHILSAYKRYGYEPIKIPVVDTPDARLELIKKYISQH